MSETGKPLRCLVADKDQSTLVCFSMLPQEEVSLTLFSESFELESFKSLILEQVWNIIVVDPFSMDCSLSEIKSWLQQVDYSPYVVIASWADDTRIVDDTLRGWATLYYIKPFASDFPKQLVERVKNNEG